MVLSTGAPVFRNKAICAALFLGSSKLVASDAVYPDLLPATHDLSPYQPLPQSDFPERSPYEEWNHALNQVFQKFCTDIDGKTYTAKDVRYRECMKRISKP